MIWSAVKNRLTARERTGSITTKCVVREEGMGRAQKGRDMNQKEEQLKYKIKLPLTECILESNLCILSIRRWGYFLWLWNAFAFPACQRDRVGRSYNGSVAVSAAGWPCLPWKSVRMIDFPIPPFQLFYITDGPIDVTVKIRIVKKHQPAFYQREFRSDINSWSSVKTFHWRLRDQLSVAISDNFSACDVNWLQQARIVAQK